MKNKLASILKKLIILYLITLSFYLYSKNLPVLNIYTYNSFSFPLGPGKEIKNIFEKKYNCKIKFISMSNSISLLNRLKIEGHLNKADIVIGLDNNLLKEAENTGLFIEHKININNFNVPKIWNNKFFLPYDYSYFTFIYKKSKNFNPPKSFKEFLKNKKWKIIYEDPRTSTLGLGLLLWIKNIYNNDVNIAWKEISKKTITVTKGWIEAYNLFLKGEADFVFGYTTSILNFLINFKKQDYGALYFTEGHPLQIELIGQLKNSKQPKLAKIFMNFILSKECQKIIAINNYMYPIISTNLPKEFDTLLIPLNLSIKIPEKLTNNAMWINEWKKNVFQ